MSTHGIAHRGWIAYPPLRTKRRRTRPARTLVWPGRRGVSSVGLIALMSSVSLALWTALPLAVLWLASRLSGSGFGLSGPAALVLAAGIPASMALGTVALARLNRLYQGLNGITNARWVPGWRRSISEPTSPPPRSALDVIMVASVLAAVLVLAASIVFTGAPAPLS
jgi:hypothetical protein